MPSARGRLVNLVAWPYYGVLLAPTLVLAAYAGQHASPYHLIRPLIVFWVAALLTYLAIGALTRRWHVAAFAVAIGAVMVMGNALLWCVLMVPWLALTWRSVRRDAGLDVTPRMTRPLNVLITVWFGVASVTAIWVSAPVSLPTPLTASVPLGRNVYLILLDGYPRADSLSEYFGFDNGPFLKALEDRSFDVAAHSGGHYPSTVQVVPTMVQMRPLETLLNDEWAGTNDQHRRLWQALNAAPVPAAYEAAGYTTISIPPPAPAVDWRSASIVKDSLWPSLFEEHLLRNGILRGLPFEDMERAAILDSFRYLAESTGASPRFVFAHFYSPHMPYLFAADGTPAASCGYECANHVGPPNPVLADRLIGQIRFLNGKVLEAIDHIIEVDPDATVVVFSDHGLRRDRADMDEWFRTLFAARNQQFPDNVTTLDMFRTLIQATGGTVDDPRG